MSTDKTTPTPVGQWVRKEAFQGKPNGSPLCWWWDELQRGSPVIDELLLDETGQICGKGSCGADYYSHVMLAEFDRPEPPL